MKGIYPDNIAEEARADWLAGMVRIRAEQAGQLSPDEERFFVTRIYGGGLLPFPVEVTREELYGEDEFCGPFNVSNLELP